MAAAKEAFILVRLEVCYDRHVKRANSALRYQKALVHELNLKLLHSWKGLSVKHLEFCDEHGRIIKTSTSKNDFSSQLCRKFVNCT